MSHNGDHRDDKLSKSAIYWMFYYIFLIVYFTRKGRGSHL